MIKQKFEKNFKTLLKDEKGNSIIEFSLVLPLLIVLTVGGVYLSVSFSQKSIMNGLAFMETRAASVRKEHRQIAEHARKNYKRSTDGKQVWLDKSESAISVQKNYDLKVTVTRDAMSADILANSLSILTGNKSDNKIKKMTSTMILPIEYITLANRSDRPYTSTTVNYRTSPAGGDFIEQALLSKLPSPVRSMIGTDGERYGMFMSFVDNKKGLDNDTHRVDGILSSDPKRNMENVNKCYAHWGLDTAPAVSEKPGGMGNFSNVNSLAFLQMTAGHIKAIQTGANAAQIAARFAGFEAVIDGVLAPMKQVGSTVLPQVTNFAHKFADFTENNNNRIFKKPGIEP